MKLVVCVIIDKEADALLLVEQNLGRGYWFPFDEIKTGETRAIAAKRIASKVSSVGKELDCNECFSFRRVDMPI